MSSSFSHRPLLQRIAREVMLSRNLQPDFPPEALAQLDRIEGPARPAGDGIRDLRELAWCSIDNDDSRDLDQLTTSEQLDNGDARIFVAIADVDVLVKKGTPIDLHARHNTTSVYTAARIFPMLPERLSTDLTSLNDREDRLANVVEMIVSRDGSVRDPSVYRAAVRSHGKLTYDSVGAWLEGEGPLPPAVSRETGMDVQLKTQDAAAQALRERRQEQGALDFDTIEAKPVFDRDQVVALQEQQQNRARQLIEEFMIAANGVSASFLESKGFAALRRVVRSPERWMRIVEVAEELGARLPNQPSSSALEAFLADRRKADPLRFPDLSLTVIKLMGAGEYVMQEPGVKPTGHFGLAVVAYTHSTAPNRRYPDLVEQRLLKAAASGKPSPYSKGELTELAEHCSRQEDNAKKTERHVRKAAAALMLGSRIGERFDGVITGASEKGTYVRVFHPPVEGRIVSNFHGLRVGKRVTVKLIGTNAEAGHIDFART